MIKTQTRIYVSFLGYKKEMEQKKNTRISVQRGQRRARKVDKHKSKSRKPLRKGEWTVRWKKRGQGRGEFKKDYCFGQSQAQIICQSTTLLQWYFHSAHILAKDQGVYGQ